jgi:hypothetical protein
MILGMAFAEAIAIYALVVAFIIVPLNVRAFKSFCRSKNEAKLRRRDTTF